MDWHLLLTGSFWGMQLIAVIGILLHYGKRKGRGQTAAAFLGYFWHPTQRVDTIVTFLVAMLITASVQQPGVEELAKTAFAAMGLPAVPPGNPLFALAVGYMADSTVKISPDDAE
jgi:hypothetical protein